MRICAQLSRLPRAGRLKSMNFRHTTPGSLVAPNENHPHYFSPTHPAALMSKYDRQKAFPRVYSAGFVLRATPKVVLHLPEAKWPDPPYSPAPPRGPGSPRVNMSLLKVISKKVHKDAVVRKKIANKMRLAVSLVVTRGAYSGVDKDGQSILAFDEAKAGHHLVLNDWTYSVTPTLEVYRMPYPQLVDEVRGALNTLAEKGLSLEKYWARQLKVPERAQKLEGVRLLAERSKAKQHPARMYAKPPENVHPLEATTIAQRALRKATPTTPERKAAEQVHEFLDALKPQAAQASLEPPASVARELSIVRQHVDKIRPLPSRHSPSPDDDQLPSPDEHQLESFGSLLNELKLAEERAFSHDMKPASLTPPAATRDALENYTGGGNDDASAKSKASRRAGSASEGSSPGPKPPRVVKLFERTPLVVPVYGGAKSSTKQGR